MICGCAVHENNKYQFGKFHYDCLKNTTVMAPLAGEYQFNTMSCSCLHYRIQPSEACGPFRVYSGEGYIMFDSVTNLINTWESGKKYIHFIGTGGFMSILGLLLW